MDTDTKTGKDVAMTASKRVVQKTVETTGDLIRNKIADKTISAGKTKRKRRKHETNKIREIYIPPEKRQQIVDDLRLLQKLYKNGIPENHKSTRYIIMCLEVLIKNGQKFIMNLVMQKTGANQANK